MKGFSLSRLPDHVLLRELKRVALHESGATADVVAHIAEVDERKLYLPAAHASMYSYCVHALRMSEDAAYKRIRAARAARQFPAIFAALAEGRLHLGAVGLLAPHLTTGNANELLSAAEHKTKTEIEELLAARFPQPDVPTLVRAIAPVVRGIEPLSRQDASVATDLLAARPVDAPVVQLAPGRVVPSTHSNIPVQMVPLTPRAKVAPLSPERFALQVTLSKSTHEKLRYAQALLGHALPTGEISEVLDRALDALVQQLEQQKFAATVRSRPRRSKANGRYVPAEVRRTVWQRDGGRCTFTSEQGQRCPASSRLEFDHVDPVARGGQTTAGNLRLRCRAHNQHAAERVFGSGFMCGKREEARRRTAETCRRTATHVSCDEVIASMPRGGKASRGRCHAT